MKQLLLSAVLLMGAFVGVADAQVVGANCTVTWDANTEGDLASYRVYGSQNGVTKTLDVLKPTTSATCAALGVQAGGVLSVQVDAVDASGNRSLKSATATVTQDVIAPMQPTGVSVSPNP